MTTKEAIFILMNSNEYHHAKGDLPHSALCVEAFNMAIEALGEKRTRGEFDLYKDDDYSGGGYILCTACKYRFSFGAYKILEYDNYCPRCGAKIIRRPDQDIKTFTFNICMKEDEIT